MKIIILNISAPSVTVYSFVEGPKDIEKWIEEATPHRLKDIDWMEMPNDCEVEYEEGEVRFCSMTGEQMNEGWYSEECGMYFKYEKDALQLCLDHKYKDIQEAYVKNFIYFTKWENQ